MIVAKIGTISGGTAKNDADVEEAAFGKDLSSLRIYLAAVTVAKGLVYLSLLGLRSRNWYQRRLCRRNHLAGLRH